MPELDNQQPVIVIGAGWAGITAALELTRQGVPCRLFEAASQPGGRARSVNYPKLSVDNGQHLMLGAYHTMLDSLKLIGISENEVFLRERLRLDIHPRVGRAINIKMASLPAPLHLVVGLLVARGLPVMDKLQALRFMLTVGAMRFKLQKDCNVSQFLQRYCRSRLFIDNFLEPLCLAALNTPIEQASMQVFLNVLKGAFTHNRLDSDLLFPKKCLSDVFPLKAIDYISAHGGSYHPEKRVTEIILNDNRVVGIKTGDELISAKNIIIATSPTAAARLMKNSSLTSSHIRMIDLLHGQPISTVYLQFEKDFKLPFHMLAMTGTVVQWLFDRRFCGQPGLIAAVMSAKGLQTSLDKEVLIDVVMNEIHELFPHMPQPKDAIAIREKRATFSAVKNIQQRRPDNGPVIRGCYLAGDYTLTPYPSTIEGAMMSGLQCAQQILADKP